MRNFWLFIRKTFRQYVSPVFLLLLLLSTVLWYITKLSYTYTAEIPVSVRIGNNHFRVRCVAEGTGSRLFAHRFFLHKDLVLDVDDVQLTPLLRDKGAYVINPFSLQNAISARNGDIHIISVGELPEITLSDDER